MYYLDHANELSDRFLATALVCSTHTTCIRTHALATCDMTAFDVALGFVCHMQWCVANSATAACLAHLRPLPT